MVACLSCSPHVFSQTSPFLKRPNKFGSQQALILLQKSTTFNHLKLLHAKIIRHALSTDQLLIRKLLHLCFSFNKIDYATLVFHQIHQPHTFTWNFMIRAYTINANSLQALLLYNLMISQGYPPDKFTFPFVVKACVASFAIQKGKEVHAFSIKTGFYKDSFLHNTLMDLYFKCGDPDSGRKVFDKMPVRNVVSWTTLITGLVASGQLDAARRVFDSMPKKNVISWTAMINGYVRNQRPLEAFELFWEMLLRNVRPNEFTLVSLLKACAQLESLKLGCWIHEYALKNGFKLGVFIGTALIDMYSKCGNLEEARQVFDEMKVKNLATWNTMITSLGVHGYGEEALSLFGQMEEANVQPDAITFVGVLSACLINNNVEEADWYLNYMQEHYNITPILEHYVCLIELYNRADMSDKICNLLSTLPGEPREGLADEIFKLANPTQSKLNGSSTEVLVRPSVIDGSSDVEIPFEYNAGDLNYSQKLTSHWSEHQLQCFKGEVG